MCKDFTKHQITGTFNLLFGMPIEQDSDVLQTFQLAYQLKKINPDTPLPISFYTPFPGTPIFQDAVKMGLHAPASLKDWGMYKTEYLAMATDLPWRNPSRGKLIYDVLTFYLPIAVPGNMGRGTIQMFRTKVESSPYRIFLKLLSRLARYRMDHMFFSCRFEIVGYTVYKRLFHKRAYVPGGVTKIE